MTPQKVFSFIQAITGVALTLGSVYAYTETKFAPKEMTLKLIDQESNQRQQDIGRIEKKLDLIYETLLKNKGE